MMVNYGQFTGYKPFLLVKQHFRPRSIRPAIAFLLLLFISWLILPQKNQSNTAINQYHLGRSSQNDEAFNRFNSLDEEWRPTLSVRCQVMPILLTTLRQAPYPTVVELLSKARPWLHKFDENMNLESTQALTLVISNANTHFCSTEVIL